MCVSSYVHFSTVSVERLSCKCVSLYRGLLCILLYVLLCILLCVTVYPTACVKNSHYSMCVRILLVSEDDDVGCYHSTTIDRSNAVRPVDRVRRHEGSYRRRWR